MKLAKSTFVEQEFEKLAESLSPLEAYQKFSRISLSRGVVNKLGWSRELTYDTIKFILNDCGESVLKFETALSYLSEDNCLEISKTLENGQARYWVAYPCLKADLEIYNSKPDDRNRPSPINATINASAGGMKTARYQFEATQTSLPSRSWNSPHSSQMRSMLNSAYHEWVKALLDIRRNFLKKARKNLGTEDIEAFHMSKTLARDNAVVDILLKIKKLQDNLETFKNVISNKDNLKRLRAANWALCNDYETLRNMVNKNERVLVESFKVPAAKTIAKNVAAEEKRSTKEAARAAKAAAKTPRKKKNTP